MEKLLQHAPKEIQHDFGKKVYWYLQYVGNQKLKDVCSDILLYNLGLL